MTDRPARKALDDFVQNIEPQIYNSFKRRHETIATIKQALAMMERIQAMDQKTYVWDVMADPNDNHFNEGRVKGYNACLAELRGEK